MAIQMTREEYQAKYGVAPVFSPRADLDTSVAPVRMTQAEYDELYAPKEPKEAGALEPAKEALKGLGTLYGGGEEGIAMKLKRDVEEGAKDIEQGNVLKGVAKAGFRTAGDIASTIFAPIGAAIEATGFGKVSDYLGGKIAGSKLGEFITDQPAVQRFAITHPNAEEDFNRALMLFLAKGETGKIEPKTTLPRTAEQISGAIKTIGEIPSKIQERRTNKAVEKIASELENIENNYSDIRKYNATSKDSGASSRERISQTDVLVDSVDTDGAIRTKQLGGAVEQYKKMTIDGAESAVRDNLKREGKKVNLSEVAKELTTQVYRSGLEGSTLVAAVRGIERELAGLRLRADEFGNIDLYKIHDAKIGTTNTIDYTKKSSAIYKKAKARAYKTIVETKSDIGVEVEGKRYGIKEINAELGKYYEDLKRLDILDGKKVKGGKLGKYAAQATGNIAGAAVGSAIGGPVGIAAGTVVGGEVGKFVKGKTMAQTFGQGSKQDVLKNLILERAKAEGKLPPKVNLKIPDTKIGAPQGVVKTKEILKTERDIAKNVEQQKAAIRAGNFELVATLKEIYKVLVQRLKDFINEVQELAKKNPQGGYVNFNADISGSANRGSPKTGKPLETGKVEKAPYNGINIKGEKLQEFKGFKDLTTKFLDYAKGKTVLSKQEILDFARRPELKKGEADNLNKLLQGETRTKIPAQEFADSIRGDLLELKPVKVKEPQFSKVSIDESQGTREISREEAQRRGLTVSEARKQLGGKNYEEVVFESPITTNGSSHYPNSKNYFAHARGDEVVESGKKIWREQEIQSDALQKEGLENLMPRVGKFGNGEYGLFSRAESEPLKLANGKVGSWPTEEAARKYAETITGANQLSPFTNGRFGERIMRERIREKAQKGYSKYRLPSGETIGRIEGFRERGWKLADFKDGNFVPTEKAIEVGELKIGLPIHDGAGRPWYVTQVSADGRFKAIDELVAENTSDIYDFALKNKLTTRNQDWNLREALQKSTGRTKIELLRKLDEFSESFDLTGKSNPQYRRYEQWGKFLKNKYGGKEVTDPQGNTWIEVDLRKEMGKLPVEAFGVGVLGLPQKDEK